MSVLVDGVDIRLGESVVTREPVEADVLLLGQNQRGTCEPADDEEQR